MKINFYHKKIRDLEIGDLVFLDFSEDLKPIQRFLVLNDLIIFDLETKEIEISKLKILEPDDDVFCIGNIYNENLQNNLQVKEYEWMGIAYSNIRLLINLTNLNIERFNIGCDEWEYLNSDYYHYENNLSSILIIDIPDKVTFKLDLSNLNLKIREKKSMKFKNYYNFLLGTSDQYVFNADNELEILT
jgi:hypothetical protein